MQGEGCGRVTESYLRAISRFNFGNYNALWPGWRDGCLLLGAHTDGETTSLYLACLPTGCLSLHFPTEQIRAHAFKHLGSHSGM
jgi:hypothetical protein